MGLGALEAQLPMYYWVPVLKSLYTFILSITQGHPRTYYMGTWASRAFTRRILGLNIYWINVRDPLYFWGYGIPNICVKRMFFLPRAMWAKFRDLSSL